MCRNEVGWLLCSMRGNEGELLSGYDMLWEDMDGMPG